MEELTGLSDQELAILNIMGVAISCDELKCIIQDGVLWRVLSKLDKESRIIIIQFAYRQFLNNAA